MKELEGTIGNHTDQDSRAACVVDYFGPSEMLSMGRHPSRIDHDAVGSPESTLIDGAIPQGPGGRPRR